MVALLRELFHFLWREKKWWFVPLLILFAAFAGILFLASGVGISWTMYR
jgi:hypothetical protein